MTTHIEKILSVVSVMRYILPANAGACLSPKDESGRLLANERANRTENEMYLLHDNIRIHFIRNKIPSYIVTKINFTTNNAAMIVTTISFFL